MNRARALAQRGVRTVEGVETSAIVPEGDLFRVVTDAGESLRLRPTRASAPPPDDDPRGRATRRTRAVPLTRTVALGILSFAPLVSLAGPFGAWGLFLLDLHQAVTSFDEPAGFDLFGALMIAFGATTVPAFVPLLVDVVVDPRLARDMRLVWALLRVLAPVVTFPIYRYSCGCAGPDVTAAR